LAVHTLPRPAEVLTVSTAIPRTVGLLNTPPSKVFTGV